MGNPLYLETVVGGSHNCGSTALSGGSKVTTKTNTNYPWLPLEVELHLKSRAAVRSTLTPKLSPKPPTLALEQMMQRQRHAGSVLK